MFLRRPGAPTKYSPGLACRHRQGPIFSSYIRRSASPHDVSQLERPTPAVVGNKARLADRGPASSRVPSLCLQPSPATCPGRPSRPAGNPARGWLSPSSHYHPSSPGSAASRNHRSRHVHRDHVRAVVAYCAAGRDHEPIAPPTRDALVARIWPCSDPCRRAARLRPPPS